MSQVLPSPERGGESLAGDPVERLGVAVTGGEAGPSPGRRLDNARPSRPWEETLVDFEARLKYSQSCV